MFHAMLICSGGDCAERFEAWGTLEELDALACDCGCGLQILGVSDCEDGDACIELQRETAPPEGGAAVIAFPSSAEARAA